MSGSARRRWKQRVQGLALGLTSLTAGLGSAVAEGPAAAPLAAPSPTPQQVSKGTSRLETVEGQRVLHLYGDAYGRGFEHGRVLHDGVLDAVSNYALAELGTGPFNLARALLVATAKVPPTLRREAEGIIDGLRAAGGARVPALDRDLDVHDLLTINAFTDLVAVGCSSLSTWGSSNDAGSPRLVRNLDWSTRPALLRNQVLIVQHPTEPGRLATASVTFAGFLGCLSCVNTAGVGAFFNMGYGEGAATPLQLLGGFVPANLLLREVVEAGDANGDGRVDRADVAAGLAAAKHAGSYIVHAIDATEGLVVEVEHKGTATRTAADDPRLPPTALIATNHHRALAEPEPCRRYDLARAGTSVGPLSAQAQWTLGRSLALGSVVNTLQYDVAAHSLRLWLRAAGGAKGAGPTPTHDLKALFATPAPGNAL